MHRSVIWLLVVLRQQRSWRDFTQPPPAIPATRRRGSPENEVLEKRSLAAIGMCRIEYRLSSICSRSTTARAALESGRCEYAGVGGYCLCNVAEPADHRIAWRTRAHWRIPTSPRTCDKIQCPLSRLVIPLSRFGLIISLSPALSWGDLHKQLLCVPWPRLRPSDCQNRRQCFPVHIRSIHAPTPRQRF